MVLPRTRLLHKPFAYDEFTRFKEIYPIYYPVCL
jgi:hypothetical protein